MTKTILCYGDSNTFGADPASSARFGRDVRWPGVLRNTLGPDHWVIEEGLGGRTTVWDDPVEGRHKNGQTYLLPCLESHKPLDLVVIMLGTNDLKKRFAAGAFDIARGAGVLAQIVQQSGTGPDGNAPQVLLLAPPPTEKLAGTNFEAMFAGAEETSKRLAPYYRQVADELGCHFLDTAEVIVSSKVDAIHLEAEEHRKLGQAVAGRIQTIFEF